jgi:hypothetical protein
MPFVSTIKKYGFAGTGSAGPKTQVTFTLPNLAGNANTGIANDIFALRDVTIKQFGVVWTGTGTANVSIYYKYGNIETTASESGWTLALTYNGATVSGGVVFIIPTVLSIDVPANSALSFMVYTTGNGNLNYSDGSALGSAFASNSDIQVRSGYGTNNSQPPLTSVFAPRNFNGAIVYEV